MDSRSAALTSCCRISISIALPPQLVLQRHLLDRRACGCGRLTHDGTIRPRRVVDQPSLVALRVIGPDYLARDLVAELRQGHAVDWASPLHVSGPWSRARSSGPGHRVP